MAPAPGSGHPDDDGPIQAPAQTPAPTSSTAMSSSQDHNRDGASPTADSLASHPSMSSTYIDGLFPTALTTIPIQTDAYGMVTILLLDGWGNTIAKYVTPDYNKQGAHSSTMATPQADSSPTASPFIKSSSPVLSNTAATSLSSSTGTASEFSEKPPHHGPPFPMIIAMSIIIPTTVIVLSLFAFYFLCIRRKSKTDQVQQTPAMTAARRVPEMKATATGGPGLMNTRAVAPVSIAAGVSPSMSPATTSSTGTGTPPVILSTTMNDAYYTGIDTSDHISLNDQRSEASIDTFGEEPPPPYRPRSVPPISRETSVRNSMCRNTSVRSSRHDPMSGSNLMRRSVDVRSPFDDPEDSDDDNISQISTIRSLPRRDTDRLSVVSDISYQDESIHSHDAVQ